MILGLEGSYVLTTRDLRGHVVSRQRVKNKLCNAGMGVLLGQLDSTHSPSPVTLLYGAVGNGAATPAVTDTQLVSEVGRTTVASSAVSSTQVIIDFFFSTVQGNPPSPYTITEVGLFLQATSTANSGSLLSHAAVSQLKTTSYTLTVEFQIVIVSNT